MVMACGSINVTLPFQRYSVATGHKDRQYSLLSHRFLFMAWAVVSRFSNAFP
jgi:hypothetical protein